MPEEAWFGQPGFQAHSRPRAGPSSLIPPSGCLLAFCRRLALLDVAMLAAVGQPGLDFRQAFSLKEGPEKRLCFLKPLFAADTSLF